MAAAIRGILGPNAQGRFPLEADLTIGRDPANHLAIDDIAVSRRHCMIARDGDRYLIRDLGSHNGTFVNGTAIEERVLDNGDRIAVGGSVFEFSADNSTPSSAKVVFEDVHPIPTTTLPGILDHETAAAMSLSRDRLSRDFAVLLKLATKLRGIRDVDSLLWQLVGVLLEAIPAERVAILLGEDAASMEPAFAWDLITGPGQPVRVSRTIVQRAMAQQRAIFINDAGKVARSTSVQELKVHSVLCAPIATPEKQLGAIYMDCRNIGIAFDDGHLHVISAIAGMTALAMENARILELLQRENEQLKSEVRVQFEMIGESAAMQEVYRFIAKVAATDSNVLIQGESGTGKELVARAIHRNSSRGERPFIAINCAAITETLLESEIFGHEKGAFTGAVAQKKGYLEVADGGTVFLDEIGELAPQLQAKLLRVLQEREFVRVGGTRPVKVDIRILAATNRSLGQMVKEGKFREDLFYRLNVLGCKIPALRSRREDIPLLAAHFAQKYSAKCSRDIRGIADDAMTCLTRYDWPGNVRELENAIEHAVVLGSTKEIVRDDLPESMLEVGGGSVNATGYHDQVTEQKKRLILDALERSNGNFTEAAKLLEIHPNYLHRLVTVLELRAEVKRTAK